MRDALAAHVKDRPTTEYLFPGAVNEWMSHKAFAEAFSRGVSLARQDEVLAKSPSPYSLRHTHASLMIANGMEIYALSRHMGHASVTMTEKAYLHLYPDAIYRAATVAEAALGQIPETPVLAVSAG
jgi:integrase